jgi:hypothetical protein
MRPLLLAALLLAAPAPTRTMTWAALFTDAYQVNVARGATRAWSFPVPPALGVEERPLSFAWTVVRPLPASTFVILEQCPRPDTCHPAVLRPTGQGSGTTRSVYRVTNRGFQDVAVLFRYTIWGTR